MTAIDHDEAARIATGYGVTYTSPSDAAVKLVFAAYLDAMRKLKDLHEENVSSYPQEPRVVDCAECDGVGCEWCLEKKP